MIYNKDIVYFHLGKTGGMSVTSYLLSVLNSPIYHVKSPHEFTENKISFWKKVFTNKNVIDIKWNRHGNLVNSQAFFAERGLKLSDFKLLIVGVRNPFEMDFSYYKHLRTKRYFDSLNKSPHNQKLLNFAKGEYDDFARQSFTHFQGNLVDFFEIDGKMPENMRVIRFEEMRDKLPEIVKPFTKKNIGFPHDNKSDYLQYPKNISKEAKESIVRKYEYIYMNYYSNL